MNVVSLSKGYRTHVKCLQVAPHLASTMRRVKCQPPTANWHESSELLLFGVERKKDPDVDGLVSMSETVSKLAAVVTADDSISKGDSAPSC
jgi:hypothetical protein